MGKSLTLYLEDERVLDFFFVSSDGEIAARSSMKEATAT